MHIMEGFLPPAHALGWAAVSLPVLAWGLHAMGRSLRAHPERRMLLGVARGKPVDSGFPSPRGMVLTLGPVFWLAFILLRAFPRWTSQWRIAGVVRLTAAGAAPEWPHLHAGSPVSRLTPFPGGNGRTQSRDITRMGTGVPVLPSRTVAGTPSESPC